MIDQSKSFDSAPNKALVYVLVSIHVPPTPQVWRSEGGAPLESPRALTDDLPSFSLSPLPYITEVSS